MTERLRGILVCLSVFLYAVTPYSSVALTGGMCGCKGPGGIKCGGNGFLCHCCQMPSYDCDEDSFSTCKSPPSIEEHSQPPALSRPLARVSLPSRCDYTLPARGGKPLEGYPSPPLKPPTI